MKKTYILNKNLKIPEDLKEKDNIKRKQIEEILGKKLNDYEWVEYKKLFTLKTKN